VIYDHENQSVICHSSNEKIIKNLIKKKHLVND